MNDDKYTIESGMLDVGDGHQIYYQRWGNKNATPILAIHGGPGSSSKAKNKNIYDPLIHQVIFYDQRGCGKSIYKDIFANNTTEALSNDIEQLRQHLSIESWHIFGYSWGSTLALYYGTKHPDRILKLLIGGVYLGSKTENDYLFNGGFKMFAPQAWKFYTDPVPEDQQNDCLNFYVDKILGNDTAEEEKIELLKHFSILEPALASTDSDYQSNLIEAESINSTEDQTGALIGLKYFENNCFIGQDYFLQNLNKLKGKDTIIVQGSVDFVCPPQTAQFVVEQLGKNCHLHLVPTSHARESAMRETLRAYLWALFG